MIIRRPDGGVTTVDEVFLHHGWPCVPNDAPHNCEEARAKHAVTRGVITLRAGREKESHDPNGRGPKYQRASD